MAHITVRSKQTTFDEPRMVEGFPGAGLVGKIAADHLVAEMEMTHYADVHCEGVPRVAVYDESMEVKTPVRIYADAAHDLLVLRADVPVSPDAAGEVADCLSGWFEEHEVTPIYLSGMPAKKGEDPPKLTGVATGDGRGLLDEAGVGAPSETGVVSGPTGALLNAAVEGDLTAVCLVVETDPRFPDPEAASVLLEQGVEPLTGVDVSVDTLVDRAEEIREARERLAERMRQEVDESTRAQPLRMYQ
jgi:uncharacterized protein